MTNSTISALLLISLVSVTACNNSPKEQAARTPKQYTSEQLRSNIAVFGAAFNGDETKILVGNNVSGIFNVHEINLSDTTSVPLTHSQKESFFAIDYLPSGNQFLYSADNGGNENTHIFLGSKNDSIAKDITPWPNTKNTFLGWNNERSAFYIQSNKRDVKYFDVWKVDTGTWQPTLLYKNETGDNATGISKSERYLSMSKTLTTSTNELYLLDRQTQTNISISNNRAGSWDAMAFEKNDSVFYYTTDLDHEFSYLVKYNINSGKHETMFKPDWAVSNFSLSENEKYHYIIANEDAKNKILLFEHAGNKAVELPKIEDGDVQGIEISKSEKNILLTIGSSTSPSNLYHYDIENKNLKRLTQTLNKEIDEQDLVKAEVIRFKSFDGKEIPAIYYKPLQADKNNKVPALLFAHGGPGGQSRVGFANSIQFLLNKGYAVLAVNNRGSSGYGKTFYKLDDKDHGNGDVKDYVWAKKWLLTKDHIDSNAIGIMGGSYGGNVVLNALIFHPDEFKVGIDIFGVTNWIRTLKEIPAYWEEQRKALYNELGDPTTADSVRLKSVSPLFNYQKINKPLMVIQGANDVRVLPIESDEIVAGVKQNNVPVTYVVFPDEGHGFVKKENQISSDNKTLAFLEQYLKPKKAGATK